MHIHTETISILRVNIDRLYVSTLDVVHTSAVVFEDLELLYFVRQRIWF